jgi:hypothetical protein
MEQIVSRQLMGQGQIDEEWDNFSGLDKSLEAEPAYKR